MFTLATLFVGNSTHSDQRKEIKKFKLERKKKTVTAAGITIYVENL